MSFVDPGNDDNDVNIGVLRDARAQAVRNGGELVYTICSGFYQYSEFNPEFWKTCYPQLRIALKAQARQE